jgi:hypothetical protein
MDNRHWHPGQAGWHRDELAEALSVKASECPKCGRRTWMYATHGRCDGCASDAREAAWRKTCQDMEKRHAAEIHRMRERGEIDLDKLM